MRINPRLGLPRCPLAVIIQCDRGQQDGGIFHYLESTWLRRRDYQPVSGDTHSQ
ncbi:hypothetical protein GFS60_07975 (plasmid) [Rhodococcus sp. WAY2]|nr:hypothetical protein GFS60_07975 [Rhodococcus sp. WAY2]